jgi:predicted Zn-dependent protease
VIDPAELCDAVLQMVPTGVEADVTASTSRSSLTRFANSSIHQNVAEDGVGVRVRLVENGRQASASTNRVDREALDRMVAAGLEAARLRPVDPQWPGVAPPAEAVDARRYDEATRFADPAARASVVRDFVEAGDGLLGAGYCDTGGSVVAFANTTGQRLQGRQSHAGIDAVHRVAGLEDGQRADGVGWQTSARIADLDGRTAGEAAAASARAGVPATDVEPGDYEVVLGPRCVADIISFVAAYGFNAKAHAEGRSFVRLGETQFDEAVDLFDDAGDHRALGLTFDAEGTPKRRVDLVRAGISTALVHDRRTARLAGVQSTGHAIVGGESFGPYATNLFVAGGARSAADLISSVERGLLVNDLWYTRIVQPKRLSVTGLTRNGTFLIEGGKITTAVSNLRFTQSYAEALGPGRVLGVASDARQVGGSAHVPSLHLASWRFTGGAKG